MKNVEILKDCDWAEGGIHVSVYQKGDKPTVSDEAAEYFLSQKAAKLSDEQLAADKEAAAAAEAAARAEADRLADENEAAQLLAKAKTERATKDKGNAPENK